MLLVDLYFNACNQRGPVIRIKSACDSEYFGIMILVYIFDI